MQRNVPPENTTQGRIVVLRLSVGEGALIQLEYIIATVGVTPVLLETQSLTHAWRSALSEIINMYQDVAEIYASIF